MNGIEQLKRRADKLHEIPSTEKKFVFLGVPEDYPTIEAAALAAEGMQKNNPGMQVRVWCLVDQSGNIPAARHAITMDKADMNL
jgi:hypothetical protein